jgi:hypothetical protein
MALSSFMPPPPENVQISLGSLLPTQDSVGSADVESKRPKVEKKGGPQKYLDDKMLKVVKAPKEVAEQLGVKGDLYFLTDGHHRVSAAVLEQIEAGKNPNDLKVTASVTDWSAKSPGEFWQAMKDNNFLWLQDKDGKPITTDAFPKNFTDLSQDPARDNPWRSIGGMLEDEGLLKRPAFPDPAAYFFEFKEGDKIRQFYARPQKEGDPDNGKAFRELMQKYTDATDAREKAKLFGQIMDQVRADLPKMKGLSTAPEGVRPQQAAVVQQPPKAVVG